MGVNRSSNSSCPVDRQDISWLECSVYLFLICIYLNLCWWKYSLAENLLTRFIFARWMIKCRTAAEASQLIKPSSQRFPHSVSSGNLNLIFQCVARGLCIDMWYSGKTEWGESIKILTQYWETSPKSSGAAFSPPFLSLPLPSLSVLPPSFTLSSVSSISRPLLYLPLASHCRALREAQTALDKVRMIHVLWLFWIWAMVKKKKKKKKIKTFWTMLFFESACNIWLNTGVSTRANVNEGESGFASSRAELLHVFI